ncbi:MAG: ABC transporter ATP-binding protein [Butyricicoccus sp.]
MAHPFVETKEMTVGYRGVPLIRDIALRVHRGEILTLIGPNGSGKSTILKLIRQLALIGGTVYLDGKSLQTLPERDLARTMSVLLTEHVRPELMTCWDVAAAGRYPYTGRLGLLSDEDRAKVDEALALVGADELADRDFSCISDGQRQRVLLARAICQEPEVIVLDEPTSFLDIRYKLELLTVLKQLVREKQVAFIPAAEIDLPEAVRPAHLRSAAGWALRHARQVFTGDHHTLYDLERGALTSGSAV